MTPSPPSDQRVQTLCLLILTAIAIGTALFFLRPVFIPFVLAVFFVFCLVPVIDAQVTHLRVRRPVAIVTTILLGCTLLVGLWVLIWNSVDQMTDNAEAYQSQFIQLIDDTAQRLPLERLGIEADEVSSLLRLPRESAARIAGGLTSSIMNLLSNGLLVIIFMIFMLAGRWAPPEEGSFRAEVESGIKRYIITKVLVSGVTGVLVGSTLALLGVHMALVFGVLAFLLNFIPSIGSVIATLLPLPVVLLSPDLATTAKVLAIAIPGGIQFSVGNLIEPRIMGGSLNLHPVTVLLSLMFFGMIWGIVGMFLATPIAATLRIMLERSALTAPVGGLLGGDLDAWSHTRRVRGD
jgi:AI-2 transport protein TqsA